MESFLPVVMRDMWSGCNGGGGETKRKLQFWVLHFCLYHIRATVRMRGVPALLFRVGKCMYPPQCSYKLSPHGLPWGPLLIRYLHLINFDPAPELASGIKSWLIMLPSL